MSHWTITGAALLLAAVLLIIGRKTGVLVRGSAGGHAAPRRAQAGEWDQPAPSQPPASAWPVSPETEGSADLDQFLPAGLYPQTLAPLPDRGQWQPHHAPDAPEGRVHDGCEISDTGQQAVLTLLSASTFVPCDDVCARVGCSGDCRQPATDWSESDQAICLCGKVPDIPGEPITSEAGCPAHGTELPPAGAAGLGTRPGEDATLTDMRPVPAPVAARENAAARWHLKAHVGYVMKRKPPLREYVEETIGPGVADLNPAYERDAAAFTVPPAEDFDSLLATARAGAVSE